MQVKRRSTCRICESSFKSSFSLGSLCVSTFIDKPERKCESAPLRISICQNPECGLWQLMDTAPQELMYTGHYWYKSALNPVIVADLNNIVREAIEIAKPQDGDIFMDIGANDGSLLMFVPDNYYKVGVEPATNLSDDCFKHCDRIIEKFWEDVETEKAKIITAIGMFYDSEDPNAFISNVKKHLKWDGLFIAQLMTLKPMYETNDVGNICHEHLEYYSFKSLKYLFEKNGLEIFRVEENGINGGSYRLYARHLKNGSIDYLEPTFDDQTFLRRMLKNKEDTLKFLRSHKHVYGYGASTKLNTILQWYGIDSTLVKGIAERNPEKIGKYTVGTHIKVFPEQEVKEKAKTLWIGPHGFLEFFAKKEQGWLERGGTFIVCTPNFQEYTYQDCKKLYKL